MNPCLKQDDIQEIKADVKEMKELLTSHLIRYERHDAEIGVVKKIISIVGTFVLGIVAYLIEKRL